MVRISMDLLLDPRDSADERGLRNPMNRTAMTEACVEVLRRLGNLAGAVEAFRVTFLDDENRNLSLYAIIRIHFSDPMGTKCWHETSYELKAGQGPPDFRIIANQICQSDFLEGAIREHIERGRKTFGEAEKAFARLS